MNPTTSSIEPVCRIIRDAIAARVFPAASLEIGTADGVLWAQAFGTLSYDAEAAPATAETVFDLASLTKVVATTSIAMHLAEVGAVRLDDPVQLWIDGWQLADRRTVSVRDLLEHCAGLPAWKPLFETCSGRTEFLAAISRGQLEYAPRTASIYSDLGFILLGVLLETAGGATLDRQWDEIRNDRFGGCDAMPLAYRPPADWIGRTAPTRGDSPRGRVLVGEVDDDNAWALGGVAGHAGLFGTAAALGRFARAVMGSPKGEARGAHPLARPETIRTFLAASTVPGSSRALGWDTMRTTSSCGSSMSPEAVGHTGFTGTSLWIDPRLDLYVVLLTNRVHPRADANDAIQHVRRAVHDAVVSGLR